MPLRRIRCQRDQVYTTHQESRGRQLVVNSRSFAIFPVSFSACSSLPLTRWSAICPGHAANAASGVSCSPRWTSTSFFVRVRRPRRRPRAHHAGRFVPRRVLYQAGWLLRRIRRANYMTPRPLRKRVPLHDSGRSLRVFADPVPVVGRSNHRGAVHEPHGAAAKLTPGTMTTEVSRGRGE